MPTITFVMHPSGQLSDRLRIQSGFTWATIEAMETSNTIAPQEDGVPNSQLLSQKGL
jgi:hypothetical protein